MTRARDINPVRLRREQLNLLLVELAEKVSATGARCSTPMLSMIEGGFVPRARSQQAIAEALDTTRESLWPEEFA